MFFEPGCEDIENKATRARCLRGFGLGPSGEIFLQKLRRKE